MNQVYQVLFFVFVFFLLVSSGCRQFSSDSKTHESQKITYTSGAEKSEEDLFTDTPHGFRGGLTQTSEYSRTGNFSCGANKDVPFAFTLELDSIQKGELIMVEMWTRQEEVDTTELLGQIVISDAEKKQYDNNSFVKKTEGRWRLLVNTFSADEAYAKLSIYGFNPADQTVFFDDVQITRIKNAPKPPVTDSTLRIYLPPLSKARLDSFLTEGKKGMILKKELKKYVRGFLLQGKDSIPAKFRLKGDWTDHLNSPKFSLRIKISGDHAWKGLKSFSIQNPETRAMMMEWYVHQFCAAEDLLTTRYEFINVELNGEVKGVYALEEHFDKQLLEARNRREGPIIKLDEEGLWEYNYDLMTIGKTTPSPAFLSSDILPFKKNRTYKNPTLLNHFQVAKSHLKKYKSLERNNSTFLDLDKFALYISILDLGNIDHALRWHNQRQYYNPVTTKLEPILFDCFQDKENTADRRLFYLVDESLENRRPTNLNLPLLRDAEFRMKYAEYCLKLSDSNYLTDFKQKQKESISKNMELLSYEYPFYDAEQDFTFFEKNAEKMQRHKDSLLSFLENFKEVTFEKDTWEEFPDSTDWFRPSIALKTFTEERGELEKTIALQSYLQSDLSIKAYSTDSLPDQLILLENPVDFSAFLGKTETKFITLPLDAKYLHYAPKNLEGRLVRTKISKWSIPKNIDVLGDFQTLEKYRVDDKIILPKGTYEFTKNIVIQDVSKLIIEAGTQIKLSKGAGFISYVSTQLNGTEKEPILITSDGSSSGFNVIAEHGVSSFTHTDFSGLQAMNKNYWLLTGAVTVYGGEINIKRCNFLHNESEDGLNLIRCSFKMLDSSISHTLSDGFDADFCSGEVVNCTISDTGNDALDFSGSEITITGCAIHNSGDKGISGGEKSTLIIRNTSVENAVMAAAAKDLSEIVIDELEINNCEFSYAAFQKKPEYGPAHITVNSENGQNGELFLDLNSSITISGEQNIGREELDVDSLYVRFQ